MIREKQRDRVISSRLVLRWKETDTACKAKARWCVHGFRDSDIHEIERSWPDTGGIVYQHHAPDSDVLRVRGHIGWEKAFVQGDLSVRGGTAVRHPPSGGRPGVPQGALIRVDREVYGLVGGMSRWRSRIVSQLKEEEVRDERVRSLPLR